MNIDEIINLVMIKMDEVSPSDDPVMVSSPLIKSVLQEASDNIVLTFPAHLFVPETANPVLIVNDDGSGSIRTQAQMLRFLSLRIRGWERSVVNVLSMQDPAYKLQSDPYLRGNPSRPLAFYSFKDGHRTIEYYSLPLSVTHELDHFHFLKITDPTAIPERLINALTWEAAKLAFMILQDQNGAVLSANNVTQQLTQLSQ